MIRFLIIASPSNALSCLKHAFHYRLQLFVLLSLGHIVLFAAMIIKARRFWTNFTLNNGAVDSASLLELESFATGESLEEDSFSRSYCTPEGTYCIHKASPLLRKQENGSSCKNGVDEEGRANSAVEVQVECSKSSFPLGLRIYSKSINDLVKNHFAISK